MKNFQRKTNLSGDLITRKIFDIEYNVTQIYLGFLFNIYTKIRYEDEIFKNTKSVE